LHQLHWCLSKSESSLPRHGASGTLDAHRERELLRSLLSTLAQLEVQCARLIRLPGRSVIRVRIDERESDLAACSTRLMTSLHDILARHAGLNLAEARRWSEAGALEPRPLPWPAEPESTDVDDGVLGAGNSAAPTDAVPSRRAAGFVVSALPLAGDGLCLRIDRQSPGLPARALDQLGFLAEDIARVDRALTCLGAFVVVGGPARSGRSSTLQAMVSRLDARSRSVQTLEADSPMPAPGWLQCVAPPQQAQSALKVIGANMPDALLADYPDTTAVLPDLLALNTHGCTVLTPASLDRAHHVLGWQPGVARALSVVVAQRLARRLCPHCARQDISQETRHVLARAANTWLHGQALNPCSANPRGCAACRGTGYQGRALIYELLDIDPAARALINEGGPSGVLDQRLQAEGRSMWDHGVRLLAAGQVSLDALREAVAEA
jgi:hypothetical protein